MSWWSRMMATLLPSGHGHVLGMNRRNLGYIYPSNRRQDYPLADNKLRAKQVLAAAGVPVPKTYLSYDYFYDLNTLEQDLGELHSFVVKPAQGSGGGGIIVISGRDGNGWISAGGSRHTVDSLRTHVSDILFGIHSFGLSDQAMIEERIDQHSEMTAFSPVGLADVRLILYHGELVLAMSRIPTRASDGKANLHQGAVGLGIDAATGRTVHGILEGEPVTVHPDSGEPLLERQIPYWSEALEVARLSARAVPLKYLGVDIAMSSKGPVVLEINVRPGLQIQNANYTGMRPVLAGVTP